MNIVLEYHVKGPIVPHRQVDVMINGEYTGTLTLRQDEVESFDQIIKRGCAAGIDTILVNGKSISSDVLGGC